MSKRFLVILLALFTVFIGIIIFSKRDDGSTGSADLSAGTNHVQGNGEVSLVEYGDFQCPACASYYPLVDQLKEEFGEKLTFQFRHFPLVNIHPNAMAAHRAAEAAGNQDAFFEMHDLLYERQNAWSEVQNPAEIFDDYAKELGLDMQQYRDDVSSQTVLDAINADIKIGQEAGAQSTPTFVLNGEKLDPAPQSYDEFAALIQEQIDENKNN